MGPYSEIKTLEEALKVIAEQDRMIGELTRKNNSSDDSIFRFKQCQRQRKKDAGYDDSVSFDIVWEETLKKAKEYDGQDKYRRI